MNQNETIVMPEVKFIQTHEKAHPIQFDGYGFTLRFCDGLLRKRPDGKDVAILATGYRVELPEGYVGQIYDLPVVSVLSVIRQESVMIVTNDLGYPKEGELIHYGLFVPYLVTGGISSMVMNSNQPMVGLRVVPIEPCLRDFTVKQDIQTPPKKESGNEENGNTIKTGNRE